MQFRRLIALVSVAGLAALCAACSPRPFTEPQLPNGGRPPAHVPFPEIADWSTLRIRLDRTPCYGTCPSYALEIRGDGTVLYEGRMFVAITGHHVGHITQENLRKLYRAFREADFFWLLDKYVTNVSDFPTYTMTIAFDGHEKTVVDYAGRMIGMPPEVGKLEDLVDTLAATDKWVRGNGESFASLQAEGWDFRRADDEHMDLITAATRSGSRTFVANLLAAGVGVSGPAAGYGCYALEQAASDGRPDLMRMLLDAGAPLHGDAAPSAADEEYPRHPYACDVLQAAAGSGVPAAVQLALSGHPDVNWSSDGRTALIILAESATGGPHGNRDFAQCAGLLLAAGAQVNARVAATGHSALIDAIGNEALVRVLLKAGADVNAADEFGDTALMHSYKAGVTQALLEAGSDPWRIDRNGKTALDNAQNLNASETFRALEVWMATHERPARH